MAHRKSALISTAMLVYWLLLITFAGGAIIASVNSNAASTSVGDSGLAVQYRAGGFPLVLALLAMAFVIGFRYEVGTDWPSYVRLFRQIAHSDLGTSLTLSDPAYAALNWLAADALGLGFWFVNLVCGLLFVYGLGRFAGIQPNPWLGVAVAVPYLVIVVAMGYSRQAVAIAMIMVGLTALTHGSFVRFAAWVLLGALFHRTAVLMIPLVALAYSRNRLQSFAIGVAACLIGYLIVKSGDALDRFQHLYVAKSLQSQGAGVRLGMNLPPALLLLAQSRRFTPDQEQRSWWRFIAICAIATFLAWIFLKSSTALDRLGLYLIPLQVFVLANVPTAFSKNSRRSAILLLIVLAYSTAVQFVWLTQSAFAVDWIPYRLYPLDL